MTTGSPYSLADRKIDPSRKVGTKPDGSPDDNDRVEIGPTPLAFREWEEAGLEAPNLDLMRRARYDRLLAEINRREYAGLLLMDP